MAKTAAVEVAKSSSARKARTTRKTSVSTTAPTIDYSKDGEEITWGTCYTMRISCFGEAREVEVAVNGGPWQACRSAVGYWWHDFSGGATGVHRISARARDNGGCLSVSPERIFSVREG